MNSLLLIIQREYLSRVKKKSFILSTLLTPVLFIGLIFFVLWLSQIKDSDVKRIAVVDQTGLYSSHLESSEYYQFEDSEKDTEQMRASIGNELFGVLVISRNLSDDPKGVSFYSEKQIPRDLLNYIQQTLNEVVKNERLDKLSQDMSVDNAIVTQVREIIESRSNVEVNTIKFDSDGVEKETSLEIVYGLSVFLTMCMYLFILVYGAMVMQGVIEEKTNRIVEVMVSSVRPFYLMMGKVIGIGLVGFTQLFIWFCITGFILIGGVGLAGNVSVDTASIEPTLSLLAAVNWFDIITFFILFFIGGYLIYASLFAMFASAVDNAQDSQQFVTPITVIFMFAFYAGFYSIHNPDGPLAFWGSMFPLTSPIVMMVRIPTGIPLWEKLLSLVILYVTLILTIKLAAKIYRVGILMYGKKPSLKELYKWMKYK